MNASNINIWQRFIGLLSLEKKSIFQIFYYAIFSGLLSLSLPLGVQAIINLIQGAQVSTSWVILIILVTLSILFGGALQWMQLRILESIQQRIFVRSSIDMSYRFPKITMEELSKYYPPEQANRFFDTLTIQKGLSKVLIDIPSALLQVTFALILLSFYHPAFIIFGILLLGLVYLVFQYTTIRGIKTSLKESKHKYLVAHWIEEIARAVVSFKLSGKTNLALKKNDALVEGYLKARDKHFSVIKIQFIKMIIFKAIITAGLLTIGGILVLNQRINIGQFVAAEIVILLVITSIEKLILGLETLYDMLTSIEKLGLVIDQPIEKQNGTKINFDKGISVELSNISYKVFKDSPTIINNMSFKLNKTSRTIIRGESGSGKSTLLRIMSGLIYPTSGTMFVNGYSIKNMDLNHYRSYLGIALEEEFPFEGKFRNNLTFGNTSIKDDTILEVLEIVGLIDFLKKMPQNLNSILYPEGKKIPYTISKKIILARAILKKPQIMILENTLSQFNKSEAKKIADYLCDSQREWGLVVVSNNSYWEKYSDQIIYLGNKNYNT